MFPARLDSSVAYDIAKAMLDGFNRHYRLFRTESARAKHRFETADWHGQQRAQRERIEFYDLRVREASMRLEREFKAGEQTMEVWQQVKLHYIGLLVDHHQPELAETFFNSVTTKILHRSYFQNDFIFVRPAVSTEYIENSAAAERPTYRAYYPAHRSMHQTLMQMVEDFDLRVGFDALERDAALVADVMQAQLGDASLRANFQIQVLSGLFFRNKGCYIVGKLINGFSEFPFALPVLHGKSGKLVIDAALFGENELLILFSFARAYFMVDMEIPSAYVQFLRSMMPRKPRNEIYNALGLAKQGKTLFYRDFLYHLRHSTDQFRIAPGIKGMVMLVFDLPSFPYVFKVIKDFFPHQKETTREQIKGKYQLVKQHDRVGRMADTLEYSKVGFPRDRFDDALIAEIEKFAPSQLEISDRDGDGSQEVVIHHVYIERRMIPLNIYLQEAFDAGGADPANTSAAAVRARAQIERAVVEYGNAIKDLVAANIFPGDMLWKNFGITRHGKVVFYDYDEIEYITDCNFRRVPAPRNEEEEMSGEVWYNVGPKDVFPETFAPFLLGNPAVREVFMQHHVDLLDADFWQGHKERILAGYVHDVFPYDRARRFRKGAAPIAELPQATDPQASLEAELSKRTKELTAIQEATILALASLAETRDADTGNHIRRTQLYVRALGWKLSTHPRYRAYLTPSNIALMFMSAPLHDIGKVGIPDRILLKPGRLTPEEFTIMKTHTTLGRDAIAHAEAEVGSEVALLTMAKEIAYSHQEKWDGSGYPQGLVGDAIPIAARLMALADVYDALISKRVYKEPIPHGQAVSIMERSRGSHFDPDVVDAFLEIESQFKAIAATYWDSEADLQPKRDYLSNAQIQH
jgi:isocitrate dehydrogenase kinase/phosphatase